MSFQPGAMLYTQSFGSRPENVEVPVISTRIPNVRDTAYPLGKRWIVIGTGEYTLLSISSIGGFPQANWSLLGSVGGALNTITGGTGGAITPVSNNITILGTANQITSTGSAGTLTLSIPAVFIAPGSIAATTSLTATSGDITATNGNLVLSGIGNKLLIHATTAASDSVGVSGAMTGTPGAVTVTTAACTTSSVILYNRKTTGGTPGHVSITSQLNGSFVLTSTGNETSTFNYLIIN